MILLLWTLTLFPPCVVTTILHEHAPFCLFKKHTVCVSRINPLNCLCDSVEVAHVRQMAPPLLSGDVFKHTCRYVLLSQCFKSLFSISPLGLNSYIVSSSAVRPDGGLSFLNQHEQIIGKGLYLTTMFQRKYAGLFRDIFPEATGGLGLYIWENKRKEFMCTRNKIKIRQFTYKRIG